MCFLAREHDFNVCAHTNNVFGRRLASTANRTNQVCRSLDGTWWEQMRSSPVGRKRIPNPRTGGTRAVEQSLICCASLQLRRKSLTLRNPPKTQQRLDLKLPACATSVGTSPVALKVVFHGSLTKS